VGTVFNTQTWYINFQVNLIMQKLNYLAHPEYGTDASHAEAVARVGLAVSSAREWCDILSDAIRVRRRLGIVTTKQLRQEYVHTVQVDQSVKKRESIKRLPYGLKTLL
jgi:hypothetical protein